MTANWNSLRLVSVICLALLLAGLAALGGLAERFENAPAWRHHPDRIKIRTAPDGHMTYQFSVALYGSVLSSRDYLAAAAIVDGKASQADRQRLRSLFGRYRSIASKYGIDPYMTNQQFIWSAAGACECDRQGDVGKRSRQRIRGALVNEQPIPES